MAVGGGGGQSNAVRAGAAFVEIFVRPNYKGFNDFANRLGKFGSQLSKIGLGTVGLGAGLLAPLAALFKGGLDVAGELQDLQDQFGLTADEVSRLGFAFTSLGADAGPVLKGLAQANTTGKGLGEFAQTLADELLAIEDPSERVRVALDKLGKGGLQFLKIAGDLRSKMGNAPIFSQAQLDAADKFGQSMAEIKYHIVTALLPFAQHAAAIAKVVGEWVQKNAGLLMTVAAVGAALITAGTVIVGLGLTVSAAAVTIKAALFAVGAAWAVVTSPVALVIAGFTAAAAAVVYFGGVGLQTITALGEGWKNTFAELLGTAMATFQGIGDAIKSGDLALAGEIALAGLKVVWETAWAQLKFVWQKFKGEFSGGWHDVGGAITLVLNDAFAGARIMFNDFSAFVARNISGVLRFVIDTVAKIHTFIDHNLLRPLEAFQAHFGLDGPLKDFRAAINGAKDGAKGLFNDDAAINKIRDDRNAKIIAEQNALEKSILDDAKKRGGAAPQLDRTGIDAAQAELARLVAEAAAKAAAIQNPTPGGARAASALATPGGAKVAFQIAANAQGQFGIGGTWQSSMLEATKAQARNVEKSNDLLTSIDNSLADGVAITVT